MAELPASRSVLEVLLFQADACTNAGSPLYGAVLRGVAEDLRAGGVCATLLADRVADPLGSALPLRLLGAVHRIVLDGRAPGLAACYPSAGGSADLDPVRPFLQTVTDHLEEVDRRLLDGVQTNEVGRSAVLVGGYAEVIRRWSMPLRVLEVGASAGLNLRWDHYAYDTGVGSVAGDPDSPLRFAGVWEGVPPELPCTFEVAERRGCDRNPLDPTTLDGRRTLRSYVWPDQLDRIARLDAALQVAAKVPAPVDRADAPSWVAEQLARPRPGLASVVTHSIVLQYLPPEGRRTLREALQAAGSRATEGSPLAWLRMEPAGERAELRLTTWPHGEDRVLATAGYHGHPVWWADAR